MKRFDLNLNFDPFPNLSTARLDLRQFNSSDFQDYFVIRSDIEVMTALDKNPNTLKEAKEIFIQSQLNLKKNTAIEWLICLKESEKLIGYIGFYSIDSIHKRAEIGYALFSKYHQMGFMTEAFSQVIELGFNSLNFHTIFANTNTKNSASHKLLVKNGFLKEAHFKEDYFFKNEFMDTYIFSKVNPNHL